MLRNSGLLLFKMSFQSRRQRICDWLLTIINSANTQGSGVIEENLVAQCCLTFFCGERLVKELLRQLKITDRIVVDFGELWIKDKLKASQILEKDNLDKDKILEDLHG